MRSTRVRNDAGTRYMIFIELQLSCISPLVLARTLS